MEEGIDLEEMQQLQEEMMFSLKERFSANLDAFKKYYPEIESRFRSYTFKKKLEFFCSYNGIPNLIDVEKNDFLYKTEDPIAFCESQIDMLLKTAKVQQIHYQEEYDPFGQIHFKYSNQAVQIENSANRENNLLIKDVGSYPNCLCVGIGLGYALARLLEQVEVVNLVLIEPDSDIFFASLHAFDWKNLLEYIHENNSRINFLIDIPPTLLLEHLENIYLKHGIFLSGSWLPVVHCYNSQVQEVYDEIKVHFPQIHEALGFFDDHLFATAHALKMIENGYEFVVEKEHDDYLCELPVFVIGSGPSLDHDIPFLRRYQDKAIIIACGTAVDSLYHAGIKPDFYANVERVSTIGPISLEPIPDHDFFKDILIMTTETCHPNTMGFFEYSAVFSKNDESFFGYLGNFYPSFKKVQVSRLSNPLVGNMGLSGAVFLGFEKIYLFGIDNGKKIGSDSMHSKFTTLYHKRGVNDTSGAYLIEKTIPANFGGECETSFFFDMSRHNMSYLLEAEKKKRPNLICGNCSDGAYIDFTKPVHSEDLWSDFEKYSDIDKTAFYKYLLEQRLTPLNVDLNDVYSHFNQHEFRTSCQSILSLMENLPRTRVDYLHKMICISETIYSMICNKNTMFVGKCLSSTVQSLFISVSRVLYHSSDENACIAMADKIMALIKDFLNEAPELYVHIKDYVMQEHLKFFPDGKVGKDTSFGPAPKLPEYSDITKKTYDDADKVFKKRYS